MQVKHIMVNKLCHYSILHTHTRMYLKMTNNFFFSHLFQSLLHTTHFPINIHCTCTSITYPPMIMILVFFAICLLTDLKLALWQRRVKHAPGEVRASRRELQEKVGGVIEELPLCVGGIENSQKLGEPAKSVRGQPALLVPKCIHLQPVHVNEMYMFMHPLIRTILYSTKLYYFAVLPHSACSKQNFAHVPRLGSIYHELKFHGRKRFCSLAPTRVIHSWNL